MENINLLSSVAQIIVAFSIGIVWIFRFDNIVKEFKQYGLSDLVRNMVGSTKIALATLLVAGIWYPSLVLVPALLMAFLMLSAQYFHFKVNNPWLKRMPSLFLLLLCLFIAAVSLK
ncbi:MAG: DoxX family protein [Bacteroidota bacterium]|nr:DoxX family protein [Bacteroidota bacterium]